MTVASSTAASPPTTDDAAACSTRGCTPFRPTSGLASPASGRPCRSSGAAMYFSVPSELRCCPMGEDFIFLSLRTDRYSLLQGAPADRFRRFLAGAATDCDIEWLAARQIVVATELATAPAAPPIPRPRSSAIDGPLPAAGMGAVAAAICAQRKARRDLARRRLGEIIEDIAGARRVENTPDIEASRIIASAFQRARRYAPAIDQCLVRGVAMRRLLAGRDARLLIGVTIPFSAHCWVQVGDTVLTDSLDLVLSFQPILSV